MLKLIARMLKFFVSFFIVIKLFLNLYLHTKKMMF